MGGGGGGHLSGDTRDSAPQPPPTLARGSRAWPALGDTQGPSERRGGAVAGRGRCGRGRGEGGPLERHPNSVPQPPPTLARGSLARPALGETWGASERRGGSGGGQCKIFSKREKFAKREKFKKQHYANGQTWIVHGIDGAGGRPRFLP